MLRKLSAQFRHTELDQREEQPLALLHQDIRESNLVESIDIIEVMKENFELKVNKTKFTFGIDDN